MSQAGSTRKRGKSWTAYWFVTGPEGERVQRSKGGFSTKRDAQAHLTTMLGSLQAGTYSEPSKMTLARFVRDEWLPSRKNEIRTSTWESYQDSLEGRVLPRIGGYRLAAITPKMIGDLRDELLVSGGRDPKRKKGLANKTVRNTLTTLRTVLDDAVALGFIPRNPAAQVKAPRLEQNEMTVWNAAEARKFLKAVEDDRMRALWALLLTTGLRRGEALGLRWSEVDLDAGTVSIVRTYVSVGYDPQWSEPKTKKGRRRVDVDPLAVAELRAHRRRQLEERMAWGEVWADQGLVFTREDGTACHPQLVSQSFERLVANAGAPSIRLHDLRHTMATLALASGVHPKVVSERLGHANISITLDTYSHVIEGMQSDAAAKLGNMLLGEG